MNPHDRRRALHASQYEKVRTMDKNEIIEQAKWDELFELYETWIKESARADAHQKEITAINLHRDALQTANTMLSAENDKLKDQIAKRQCVSDSQGYCGYSQETMNALVAERNNLTQENAELRTALNEKTERIEKLCVENGILWENNKTQTERIEKLEDALHRIQTWARAYPLDIFPKPDLKKAREVLEAAGLTLDAISADAMRHVLTGIQEEIEQVLKENA